MSSPPLTPSRRSFNKTALFTLVFGCAVLLPAWAVGCNNTSAQQRAQQRKVGVLLVSHGSRSETWRKALTDLDTSVRQRLLASAMIAGVKSAFMEYTEPSIATRLKEFDKEAYSDVIVIPIFLTVSPHPFDDIPTIMNQKTDPQSLETIKVEGIERYSPKAKTHITPLLDFTDLLEKNIVRRVSQLSKESDKEGIVLVAYGDETYEKEWSALLNKVGEHTKVQTGIGAHSHAWCGHIVHYDPEKTTSAISQVLRTKERALVIPVLVAHDERFQIKLIGDAIAKIPNAQQRVVYRPDSILPDENLEMWVVGTAQQYAERISSGGATKL